MIASIRGIVASNSDDFLVVVLNDIGYKVFVPDSVQAISSGSEIFLHTHLVVREDSLTLYGFKTPQERRLFETLLTVSGIGPKVALSILGTLGGDNLRNAVASERAELLTRVPGIGKKTAQKILFELKDKLKVGLDEVPIAAFDDVNSDVFDSLIALGYSVVEAQSAIQSLPLDAPDDIEERLRMALQFFG
ncbi:MAG: Holliday junction branch migration protein RuvA [Anaerolineaceae bacterium]|nr:MAG: Holliday junction branch migration protein RuvA [Anaerolineaceae bacterium]